jgi:hypothetical protein
LHLFLLVKSFMAQFDFSTLNGTDLQDLVCDLLNASQPISSTVRYKTFKEGRDRGIDFLYSTLENPYEHVGQVKHFLRTGIAKMLTVLQTSEASKVRLLNPTKYIFATSLPLGVSDTERIKNIFHPFIKSYQDILSQQDLNRLLDEHPNVLDNHFKLWFSSTSVLQRILNTDIEFRTTDFVRNDLPRSIRLYIETAALKKARAILDKTRFVILSGEPGVGKTTLADILICSFLKSDFKLTVVLDDIKDLERAVIDDNSKQVLYFDDFLGSNSVEINKAKGTETALWRIIRRIGNLENKYLIFTTRSHLLNSTLESSERLRQFNLRMHESVLQLNEYTDELKSKILDAHTEECNLTDVLVEVLESQPIRDFIVNHENFYPRSVAFITNEKHVGHLSPDEFRRFIHRNFNNPAEIWLQAYNEQLLHVDRILLNTLVTFGGRASMQTLERALHKRLKNEPSLPVMEINFFTKLLRRLQGGFLRITDNDTFGSVQFINPSLTDFLVEYLKDDEREMDQMLISICHTNQLSQIVLTSYEIKALPHQLLQDLMQNYNEFVDESDPDRSLIIIALTVFRHGKSNKIDGFILKILSEINDWGEAHLDYLLSTQLASMLKSTSLSIQLKEFLSRKMLEILPVIVLAEDDIYAAVDLLEEFDTYYDLNYSDFHSTEIDLHLTSIINDYIQDEIETLKDFLVDVSEVDEKLVEIEEIISRVEGLGFEFDPDLDGFRTNDWHEIMLSNQYRSAMENDTDDE